MPAANIVGEAISSVPKIQIPSDFQLDASGWLLFQAETVDGRVQVKAIGHAFYCRGTAAALVAYCSLQPEWLPGIPGNLKIRQCIAFDSGLPYALKPKRRGIPNRDRTIIITRRSKQTYEVSVPLTDEQKTFVKAIVEQHQKKVEEEKSAKFSAELRAALRQQSPDEVREKCLKMIDLNMGLLDARMDEAGFRFNKDSDDRITRAYNELRGAFAEGGIVRDKTDLRRDGNVIYLGAQPAAEVT